MLNKAQIIGNLGADPKVSVAKATGLKVASFSVATTEKGYTKHDGKQIQDRTEWHNVVCFGRMAEVVEKYVHKGSKVFIEGKMRTRFYDDQSGCKRTIMEINADAMEMLDPKPAQRTQQQPPAGGHAQQQYHIQQDSTYDYYAPEPDAEQPFMPF